MTQDIQANFFNLIRERQSIRSYDPSVTISEEELKPFLKMPCLHLLRQLTAMALYCG